MLNRWRKATTTVALNGPEFYGFTTIQQNCAQRSQWKTDWLINLPNCQEVCSGFDFEISRRLLGGIPEDDRWKDSLLLHVMIVDAIDRSMHETGYRKPLTKVCRPGHVYGID